MSLRLTLISFLQVALFSVLASFVAMMTLAIIVFRGRVFTAISASCYIIALLMPMFGYASGYTLATIFSLPDASKRTIGKYF